MANDAVGSAAFAERYRAAKAFLRGEMDRLGLLESAGWRISEIHRDGLRGSEIVLRPIHLRLSAPEDLECVVWVDETGDADAQCSPGISPPRLSAP